jgi:monodechloroaminopyrrolnitrin synthase PrnB-like protein
MTVNTENFDRWIRSEFVELNTTLEEIYFAQHDRSAIENIGEPIKKQLVEDGRSFILQLLKEGNTDEGFDSAFDLLGNVGLYMAACRRHDVSEPSRERTSPLTEASGLALHLGASIGVTPRFATSHLATHNLAKHGRYKSFTSLRDESIFIDYNTRGIFAYKRAADALVRILPLGISHPVAYDLLLDARNALLDVAKWNEILFHELNTDRFFFSVRPYYKPYRVGLHEYRGANAGDFCGINEIDLLLGLCNANNISYSQLLVDKFLFMMPEDQARLRDCMRRRSLMDSLLEDLPRSRTQPWFQRNARMFLEVCKAHGAAALQHHNQLVKRFIETPSHELPLSRLTHITASGPPLEVLLGSLEKLRDLRTAAERDDIPSRYRDIQSLQQSLL